MMSLLLSSLPAGQAAESSTIRYTSVTSTDGVVLSVGETGTRDAPAVLFLHGIGQSQTSWRRQLESPLALRLRLAAMDLRGHGDSGKPSAPEAYLRTCNGLATSVSSARRLDSNVPCSSRGRSADWSR